MPYNYRGYSLSRVNTPTADVLCEHSRPIGHINKWDYGIDSGSPEAQPHKIGYDDLVEWVEENHGWLGEECLGHRNNLSH